VATLLAGLASSEMTRAQYERSLAAQQQSKAGDQWSFFQAKKLRGAMQQNTLDLLHGTVEVRPFDSAVLRQAAEQLTGAGSTKARLLTLLDSAAGRAGLAALQMGALPEQLPGPALAEPLAAALQAVEGTKAEAELAPIIAGLSDRGLADALRAARDRSQAFDAAVTPANQAIDQLEAVLAEGSAVLALSRNFTAARLRYAAWRYDAEARLNQTIANLYELQVRRSNLSAERHRNRSERFFYGMLAAQAAVIISTLSMAARQRNLLWTMAAIAGIAAITFAIYVYLWL
jgi:hypothetical protein